MMVWGLFLCQWETWPSFGSLVQSAHLYSGPIWFLGIAAYKKSHLMLGGRLDPVLAQVSIVPLKQRSWHRFNCNAHLKHD